MRSEREVSEDNEDGGDQDAAAQHILREGEQRVVKLFSLLISKSSKTDLMFKTQFLHLL